MPQPGDASATWPRSNTEASGESESLHQSDGRGLDSKESERRHQSISSGHLASLFEV